MNGVDETEESRGRDEPDAVGDTWAPVRRRPPLARVVDRVLAPIRPWVVWFGLGRLLGSAATVVLAIGIGWWLLRPAPLPTEASVPYAAPLVASTTAVDRSHRRPDRRSAPRPRWRPTTVVVHIAGAVLTPGVVAAAGGIAGRRRGRRRRGAAGRCRPGRRQPGRRCYRTASRSTCRVRASSRRRWRVGVRPAGSVTSVAVGPIDLNRASAAELDQLPGVGPATAAAIVAHRDANGPFSSVDDLEAVRGIGPAKVEALRPLVTT